MADQNLLRQRLREVKARLNDKDPELIAQFDLSPDGHVTPEEWERVRAWVVSEVEREERELAMLRDDYDILDEPPPGGPPPSGSPYTSQPNMLSNPSIFQGLSDPFNRSQQAGQNLRFVATTLLVCFIMPWMHFSVSVSGIGGGGVSETLWLWELGYAESNIFVYYPLLACIALVALVYFLDLGDVKTIKAGGVIGVLGLISFYFTPVLRAKGMDSPIDLDKSTGDVYLLLLLGVVVLAFASHHVLRRPDSSITRFVTMFGALCIFIAMLLPVELPDVETGEMGEHMQLFYFFTIGNTFWDTEAFGFGTAFWTYLIGVAHILVFLAALVALGVQFTVADPERRIDINKHVRTVNLLFLPVALICAFFLMAAIGNSLEEAVEAQAGGRVSIAIQIWISGLIFQGLMWGAYLYIGAAGVSMMLYDGD